MKRVRKKVFHTITGRSLDLTTLSDKERAFLTAVQRAYKKQPKWSEFAAWWPRAFTRTGLGPDSLLYRLCQDLEARLGIAQGKVSRPDYRDFLADLIEERYGSRYRFCKETGVDPGHLSRVFTGHSEFSIRALERILAELHASVVIEAEETLTDQASPERALAALASV
jgi:transcriptional regulator with XRE-family HTH domain